MSTTDPTSPTLDPEIFILAVSGAGSDAMGKCLTRGGGYIVRGFGRDEIHRLVEEFRAASPRPALLITGTLGNIGGDYPGLAVAKTCRGIDPSSKVILTTMHNKHDLPRILSHCSMTFDATLARPFDMVQLVVAVNSLLGAPSRLLTANERKQIAVLHKLIADRLAT